MPSLDTIRRAPKVLLHDHLDGGLRPRTIIELAAETGYADLPTTDEAELGRWFTRGADRKSLELYLETFAHTVGVMQTADAIARVARECAEDLAADGVAYAEVRYAPELSTARGLSLDAVMEAWLDGFRQGAERAAATGHPIVIRALATAMRQADRSLEIADLALRFRDRGVVGFDIAGPEAGFPPSLVADAFHRLTHASFHLTIHAGEGYGLPSIREALELGAERLGHGVRIVDDITIDARGNAQLGRLAAYVRDRRIPLELCPTSNVHIGLASSVAEHPFDLLRRLRFRVTLNTDNRLMSDVTLSSEFAALDAAHGIGLGEMEWLTLNAIKSAFLPFDERLRLIDEVIKPGYARLRREAAGVTFVPNAEVPAARRAKLTPKVILEGTRLTHKTDVAFALNEHPRVVGPRRYRYHSPLVSAEWCGFSPTPWGHGPIDFEPEDEDRAMETFATWARLFELQRYYSWIVDRFHLSARAFQLTERGRDIDFGWLEERLAPLGFHVVLLVRRPETFAAARAERLTVSGKPEQYDDLGRFVAEQELLRRLAGGSRLPAREIDISDDDVPAACERIADWLGSTGGLWAPP